jgi:hypothetical protein
MQYYTPSRERTDARVSWLGRLANLLPVLLPFITIVWTGLIGVDFGYHWDENWAQLHPVRQSVEAGSLLPNFYIYPSVNYWLNLAGAAPELVTAKYLGDGGREYLLAFLETYQYHMRVRTIRIIVSGLSVLWVYLSVLGWGRHWSEALLAASILGFSWEVGYHMRWIAPDTVMMQFGALTILFVTLAQRWPSNRMWLRCAAVAAGLACGTKYTAGLLLVPVLVAVFWTWDKVSTRRGLMLLLLETLVIFAITYLITTPGTVLQSEMFIQHLRKISGIYRSGHYGHTVSAGPEHLSAILIYLGLVLFSPYVPIAALFCLFSLLGVYALFHESRKIAISFFSFPFLYLLFMSAHRVMIVRNLLVVAPFLAILAARGMAFLWRHLGSKLLRVSLAVFVASLLAVNGLWLVYAAGTIQDRGTDRYIRELAAYIDAYPDTLFFVSDRVWPDLASIIESTASNVTRKPSQGADEVVFYASEIPHPDRKNWPATGPNLVTTWFGPREVNFDYYPSWRGDDRILLMSVEQAAALGFPVSR